MKKPVLVILLWMGHFVYADNTTILKCNVSQAPWTASFTLDAVGAGFLKVSNDGTEFNCSLRLDYFNYSPRSIVSTLFVDFAIGECKPESAALAEEILPRHKLMIDMSNRQNPVGRVQWLRSRQPDTCKVEKLNVQDVSTKSKKWIEGKWGRSTASVKKGK